MTTDHVNLDLAANFLAASADASLDTLTTAIAQLCANGWGVIMTPDTPKQTRLTHLYEIDLFGIPVTGETMQQAVANWRTVATRCVNPDADAA